MLFNMTWKKQKGNNIKMSRSDRIMGVREGRVGVSVVELSVSSARRMALLVISVSYLFTLVFSLLHLIY
jgi:hypothetical protein